MRKTYLHRGWQFAEKSWQDEEARYGYSRLEWLPADVPGNVHSDLMRHGVIPDPFDRAFELGAQWVDQGDWSYRTTFTWAPDPDLPRRILRFEGLDTVCDIALNGAVLACHDNMFCPLEIDVTERLIEGENTLQVDFVSAVRAGEKREQIYFREEGLPEYVERFPERSFVRKVQCQFGWDWGPRLVSCGIWRPVALLEFSARILDIRIRQETTPERARIAVEPKVEGEGVIRTRLFDFRSIDQEFEGSVEIEQPRLWSPNGMGSPTTYHLETTLEVDGEVVDSRLDAIGLRTIRLIREPDAHGESFEFEVNGRPCYIRGANWIPDHALPSEIRDEAVEARVRTARDMNMNMLRVWGGGMYESDAFYDACDRYGIMVWQDFMFACAYYPDDGQYAEAVGREARVQIERLRNRTSLALWCGNNENHQMFYDRWTGDGTPPRYYGEALYHQVIPDALAELDPDRPYWPSSAYGGDSPNQGGTGDQHFWDAWHGGGEKGGDWRRYAESRARFCSEFGFASACSLPLWDRTLTESDWHPRAFAVRWHDKTMKGTDTFFRYVGLHYPEPQTLEDWVYLTQLNQRDAFRFAIEHFRRSDFCRGTLIWQLNDCWPTQSWAILDYGGSRKAAAFEMKRLYQSELLSITREGSRAQLWAVNDGQETWEDAFILEARSLAGEVVRRGSTRLGLAPGERRVVLELDLAGLPTPETFLWALSGRAWPTFQFLVEPKELRLGPPVPLRMALEGQELVIETPAPLFDLVLSSGGSLEGDPHEFADFERQNVFTVPEPGLFRVPWRAMEALEARSLAGYHEIEIVRGPLLGRLD
jgi:beta-mannosidase